MYRPTYFEAHCDQDWDELIAQTVEPEPVVDVDSRPIEESPTYATYVQASTGPLDPQMAAPAVAVDEPLSRGARASNERLIEAFMPVLPAVSLRALYPEATPAIHDSVVAELPTKIATRERPAEIVYDALQLKAIQDCNDHLFTNISGTAGVGKTLVAKEIMKRYPGTVLAATTGIASVNLGEGTTINALLHYFNTAMLGTKYMEGNLRRVVDHLRKAGIRRILIDEKSMMAGQQLTFITRAVRESNEGGVYALEEVGTGEAAEQEQRQGGRVEPAPMGITLCGDFGQLPPVPDSEEYKDKQGVRKYRKLPVQFAFDSPEWPLYAAHTTRLTTIYRQDAQDFIAALHAVRAGNVVAALKFFTPDRFSDHQDDQFDGTTILPKNEQVDRYNQLRLDQLYTDKMIARSIRIGEQRPDWKNIPETLVLKEEALVMLLANRRVYDDMDKPTLVYANGDLAHLIGKDEDGAWQVRLKRNGRTVIVYPVDRENLIPLLPGRRKQIKLAIKAQLQYEGFQHTQEMNEDDYDEETSYTRAKPKKVDVWDSDGPIDDVEVQKAREQAEYEARLSKQINDNGKGKFEIIGTITYMPLRAAYGCTVHKTQGLTLDDVQVNIRDPFMAQPGMLFVALSRARSAEGLKIIGDQATFIERCKIEPRVQPWL